MDKSNTLNSAPNTTIANGMFIRGIIVSNRATAFNRKEGSDMPVAIETRSHYNPAL